MRTLTPGFAGSPGDDAEYPEVGKTDDDQRNEVHRNYTEQVIRHFLTWRREETKCDALVEVRDLRMLFYMEHHTLQYKHDIVS